MGARKKLITDPQTLICLEFRCITFAKIPRDLKEEEEGERSGVEKIEETAVITGGGLG